MMPVTEVGFLPVLAPNRAKLIDHRDANPCQKVRGSNPGDGNAFFSHEIPVKVSCGISSLH